MTAEMEFTRKRLGGNWTDYTKSEALNELKITSLKKKMNYINQSGQTI